jgi:hypothetical protein
VFVQHVVDLADGGLHVVYFARNPGKSAPKLAVLSVGPQVLRERWVRKCESRVGEGCDDDDDDDDDDGGGDTNALSFKYNSYF